MKTKSIKRILSLSIGTLLIGGGLVLGLNTNKTTNKLLAADIIDMSDTTTYTKITANNISSLEKGDRVYFILAYNSMGIADNALGKTNVYAELSYFEVTDIKNNTEVSFSVETTNKYISLNAGQLSISSNDKTYLSVDSNGYWSSYIDSATRYLSWNKSAAGLYTYELMSNYPNKESNYFFAFKLNNEVNHIRNLAYLIEDDLVCNNGVTPPSTSKWGELNTYYTSNFSDSEKSDVISLNRDKSSSDIIERSLAKYDYIVDKYGEGTYSNFLNRNVTGAASSRTNNILFDVIDNNNENNRTILIVTISLLSSISLVTFFLYTRIKNKNN